MGADVLAQTTTDFCLLLLSVSVQGFQFQFFECFSVFFPCMKGIFACRNHNQSYPPCPNHNESRPADASRTHPHHIEAPPEESTSDSIGYHRVTVGEGSQTCQLAHCPNLSYISECCQAVYDVHTKYVLTLCKHLKIMTNILSKCQQHAERDWWPLRCRNTFAMKHR